MEYTAQLISIPLGVNKQPWYLELSPCGRIPCIIDHDNGDFAVFETQAIVQYLARTYDKEHKFLFTEPKDIAQADMWLAFAAGELSYTQASCLQFVRWHPLRDGVVNDFGQQKYVAATEAVYSVMDKHLEGRDYLAGAGRGRYSIADMLNWPWVSHAAFCKVDLGRWANLKAWYERIRERPAVQRAVKVPNETNTGNEAWEELVEQTPPLKEQEAQLDQQLKEAKEKYTKKA